MWSAITKIFTKNSDNTIQSGCETPNIQEDRNVNQRSEMDSQDTYDTRQAKQRASVKWLLSKAFNNKVPENLKEPFYRDHENQEHLKPQIVGALANAEMYCLALGNIYSDPNYHNLNHWSILQTLARKGVFVSDPNDSQITETTLIQTNPLRMNAHMAVIESTMTLYAKEVVTPDRVIAAVQRFNHGRSPAPPLTENYEQGLLLWISQACDALRKRIEQDLQSVSNGGGEGDQLKAPNFPEVKDLRSLCDGVPLASLISYYCPDELPWTQLKVSYLPNVSESLHNLNLVQKFCQECLSSTIFHMMPEDITYMRGSMKQNLLVFLADLFNVLEINPIKCVRYPDTSTDRTRGESFPARNSHGVVHKRNLPQSVMTPIPDLRSSLEDTANPTSFQVSKSAPAHVPLRKTNSFQSTTDMSEDSLRRGSDDSFVVHRSKNIPTLSSVIHNDSLIPARIRTNKEKQNNDSKADERGDSKAAGRPSNWEDSRKSSFAGRRSRRNSVSDDSQLTIENFGGSQDNINFIGRNPDKQVAVHIGRKISAPAGPSYENPAIRSTLQDAMGSFKLGYDNGCEKQDNERENYKLKRQLSNDEISLRNLTKNKENNLLNDTIDDETDKRMSFADINKQKQLYDQHGGIQLVYMQNDKEDQPSKSSFLNKSTSTANGNPERKTTTFATLPNTTTWQQQSSNQSHQNITADSSTDESSNSNYTMNSQLNDIRLKLEEKRRHIEGEKRRIEVAMNKQRQKVGKAAFLQAVVKGKGSLLKTPTDSETSSNAGSETSPSNEQATSKPQRPLTLQEITDDASSVERKWLDDSQPFIETRRTPDLENMDVEQYQQSIAQMNSSLHDIQTDIQRLATQQNQIHQQQFAPQQKQHLHPFQQPQHYQVLQSNPQYTSQQSYNPPDFRQGSPIYNPIQSSASAPHIPQTVYQQTLNSHRMEQPQFFLHDQTSAQQPQILQQPVVAPQRRTWAQQAQQQQQQQQPIQNDSYQQPEMRTWNHPTSPFILHETNDRYENSRYQDRYQESPKYQNGVEQNHNTHSSFTLSQQYAQQQLFGSTHATPSASPQHKNVHRQISQLMDESKRSPISLQQLDNREIRRSSSTIMHAPIPAPSAVDMEPQNISFIGNPDEEINDAISRLNITSGSRTYRIPSPTRPLIRTAFQQSPTPLQEKEAAQPLTEISSLDNDPTSQKGFYISFDNEQPKRPKPPLRMKRGSPKKELSSEQDYSYELSHDFKEKEEKMRQLEKELELERLKKELAVKRREEQMERQRRETSQEREKVSSASAIIIGNDLSNPDPDMMDEREKKKERIMLLSLQRRQQQEESKQKKEQEAQARREREKAKEDEKLRKKEEQVQRRAAILEQYKFKKAVEEAEREGKHVDTSMLNTMKPTPKMRSKGSTPRPRPKTIHIDSGSVEMAEGMLPSSRGKRGSNTNLTANSYSSSTMRRDYYRGSQDSLADRGLGSTSMLYKDSPDDSRGMSPCNSANQTLGRRSSYKTSRDPSPAQVRGRPKLSTYQNFKGRKSNSMMNLYGSSTDQDSMAYRYGDTDSGLGRATPPRRAPSPGMGTMRHLPSPSGPGSLPGLMPKRRMFDDGSSDISSTPSSMMDYTGPRLYKQPATKSNRGIMLNAVEYCVFPGAVNRESKSRVLEEIARSESKHFLILFRDAGCQFRALYSYCPEADEVLKLYGTGPKQVHDRMFDKFFKYNSGGKCFSQVHTKHLTVTIDAFTIHNSLWQGKKVNLPNKKDMALVI